MFETKKPVTSPAPADTADTAIPPGDMTLQTTLEVPGQGTPATRGRHFPPELPCIDIMSVVDALAKRGYCPMNHGDMLGLTESVSFRTGSPFTPDSRRQIIERLNSAEVSICDLSACCFDEAGDLARILHLLFERGTTPLEHRIHNQKSLGLWNPCTPEEIREILAQEGAQLLLALGPNAEAARLSELKPSVFGAYIYHLGRNFRGEKFEPGAFSEQDELMIRTVLTNAYYKEHLRDKRIGIAHVVAIDPLVQASSLEGGLEVARPDIMSAFNGCLAYEARAHGLDVLVGYVRISPAANAAERVHYRSGFLPLPGAQFSFQDVISPMPFAADVVNQVLFLDLSDPRQNHAIEVARSLKDRFFYLDLDPNDRLAMR